MESYDLYANPVDLQTNAQLSVLPDTFVAVEASNSEDLMIQFKSEGCTRTFTDRREHKQDIINPRLSRFKSIDNCKHSGYMRYFINDSIAPPDSVPSHIYEDTATRKWGTPNDEEISLYGHWMRVDRYSKKREVLYHKDHLARHHGRKRGSPRAKTMLSSRCTLRLIPIWSGTGNHCAKEWVTSNKKLWVA